ncbi:MAG TPA: hypothetical protein VKR31_01425 [Rhizomicrobium sp.]|nr:hypothetical protein [Rhizomicrobium sp.]
MKNATLVFAAGLICAAPAAAQPPQQNACFLINQFNGWKSPDTRTIFIRVGLDRIFRLDLANNCSLLAMPNVHLITKTRGPDLVCSAIDWDLSVSESPPGNIPQPCIVKKMTLLSPGEAAAIPPKFRP